MSERPSPVNDSASVQQILQPLQGPVEQAALPTTSSSQTGATSGITASGNNASREGVLPYKGLRGTCGQPGYVFRDFCPKQGIEFIIFCLNQGIGLSIFVLNWISLFIEL